MANKKTMTAEKLLKEKADNLVVYQVMAALVLLCGCLAGLRRLRTYYATIGGMEVLDPLTLWIAGIGAAAFVVCFILLLTVKNKTVRLALPLVSMVFALMAVTGVSMKLFWTQGFSSLYYLCAALFIQYMILQLYRWEFFLFSLSTVSAGFLFFSFRSGFQWTVWNAAVLIAVVVILVGVLIVTKMASKNGIVKLGKKRIMFFGSKFSPVLLYLVCALWLACLVAALILGGLFAYYCLFAAIAVEFIAAVYYTFQLN